MAREKSSPWQGKVGNPAQVGGIETAVLDNGPAKGARVAWVNTGAGLRYKVVLDRAMDIADAFHNQHSLVWLSHGGVTAPRPDVYTGLEWLYTFAGGLVTTCGLTHVGGPEDDDYGMRGLHGRITNLPATIESVVQPDLRSGKLDMQITGVMKQSRVFGPNLELRRTISSTLGRPALHIRDVVTNAGNTAMPHMILYHCNFGWPLADEGTEILAKGDWKSRGLDMDNAIFNGDRDYHKCPSPLDNHKGGGEGCAFVDVQADSDGLCHAGLYNARLGFAAAMRYKKKQLPWLSNWQHWGPGEYVTGLEPGTNPPVGQTAAREQGTLIMLDPGESRTYELEIRVVSEQDDIKDFLAKVR